MQEIINGLKIALTIIDEHEVVLGQNMDSELIKIKINEKIQELEDQFFKEMEKTNE